MTCTYTSPFNLLAFLAEQKKNEEQKNKNVRQFPAIFTPFSPFSACHHGSHTAQSKTKESLVPVPWRGEPFLLWALQLERAVYSYGRPSDFTRFGGRRLQGLGFDCLQDSKSGARQRRRLEH